MESAGSLRVCVGSLRVLQLLPTAQRHGGSEVSKGVNVSVLSVIPDPAPRPTAADGLPHNTKLISGRKCIDGWSHTCPH